MAVDMTQVTMLDDVDVAIEAKYLDATVKAIAGYVNGNTENWPAIVQKWGKSGLFLLSIDVQGNPTVGGQCADIEKGDMTIGQAPGWFKATKAAGVATGDLRFFPKLYISAGSAASLIAVMSAAGIERGEYLLWTAHYTDKPHICSPAACGYPEADATQWTSTDHGANLDASLCYAYFFAGAHGEIASHKPVTPPPPVVTPPVPQKPKAPGGLAAFASYRGADLVWLPVPGVKEFDVQLVEAATGKEVGRTSVSVLKASFPVLPATKYEFRVASKPGGDWSPVTAFESAPLPPPVTPGPTTTLSYLLQTLAAGNQYNLPVGTILLIPKEA
jgi:hypothetical protein